MKIYLSFFSVIFLFFFFACSKHSEAENQTENFETLKEEAESLNSKVVWTEELEQGRLSEKIKTPEGIKSKLNASILSVSAIKNDNAEYIYPDLKGFGSLNTKSIPSDLKSKIENFCDSFSKNQDLSSFSRSESLYNLALFYYDLNSYLPEFQNFFNDEKSSGKKTKKFFNIYTLGEPFIDGVNYDVPLRFSSKNKILTLETYWTSEDSEWMLDQIQVSSIDDAGKTK